MKPALSFGTILGLFLSSAALAQTAPVTFTLDNPDISGQANDVITFTGTITNDSSTLFVTLLSTDFRTPDSSNHIGNGGGQELSSDFGTYVDIAATDPPPPFEGLLGPGESYSGPIGEFTFSSIVDATTPPVNPFFESPNQDPGVGRGVLELMYETTEQNPFDLGYDPSTDVIDLNGDLLPPATITFAIPEPSMLLTFLSAACLIRNRRR